MTEDTQAADDTADAGAAGDARADGTATTDGAGATAATGTAKAADAKTIADAVGEIRREGYKAAALHAVVDGVAALLLVNLVGIVAPVALPAVGPVGVATVAGVVVGLAVLVAEFRLRTTRYTVERFEADNPVVAGALRTARDAADHGSASTMARRLYGDVTDRLSETSSLGFVQTRWLGVSVVLVLVLGVATVQATAVGFTVTVDGGGDDAVRGPAASPGVDNGTTRLKDGEDVLGRVKNVSSGTEELGANVSAATGGQEGEETHDYGDRGLPDEGSGIGAERAGFDEEEAIDDADLVREYNLRLQASDDDE